jgi:LysR family glycine cleavage system transcriptional activator
MARKLPPLHLLYLFEAAARNLSFKKAAEELFLTPSAISHQIKALEENLGIALFTRLARGVKLTIAGTSYLAVVQEVFQKLEQGSVNAYYRVASRVHWVNIKHFDHPMHKHKYDSHINQKSVKNILTLGPF